MGASGIFQECDGFDWDDANFAKNWIKHQVTSIESEEIFFNKPLVVAEDTKHSMHEKRYYALGKTNGERELFVVFCMRKNLIRIISARSMSEKERQYYEKIETDSTF